MSKPSLENVTESAARRGFINEAVSVQGMDPGVAKQAYQAAVNAGNRRGEKISSLAEAIKSDIGK